MVCIYCRGETEVINSRHQKRNNQVWRRRQCKGCRAVFTTHEAIDLASSLYVQSKGSTVPFELDKLYIEILLSIQDRPKCFGEARELTDTIIQSLLKISDRPYFTTEQISRVASGALKRFDRRAWLRFVAEHPSLQA